MEKLRRNKDEVTGRDECRNCDSCLRLELMLPPTNEVVTLVKAVRGVIPTLLAIFALLACLCPPYMNFLPSPARSIVPIPQAWDASIFPVKKCTLFPRTQSLASGFASAPCLSPHSSSAAKGVAAGKTAFFYEIYSRHPHLHGRRQTNAVFWGQLQSGYLLISLIMWRLPCTRLHNKVHHKTTLVGMFRRCLRAYFCPVFRCFPLSECLL